MRPHRLTVALLLCLFCLGAIVWYLDHACVRDRVQIESIISGDTRFTGIQVKRLGNGLFLDGSVATTEDLNLFFQKVNEVKRGRVLSRITVQAARPSN